jgi:transcriptional regulator with XRE-family HTH domain
MDSLSNRRRLLAELKRLRGRAGANQRQVADALDWSPSKINRIEKGDVSISVTDLRALLGFYRVDDEDLVESLVGMARGARTRQLPFSEFKDFLPPEVIRFFGYERAASRICELELLVVPGLLQTSEYTRGLMQSYDIDESKTARFVRSREIRQQLLEAEQPPQMSFIIDESVLNRAIGGPDVMREQLHRLLALNALPHVSIQVLPFALGAHPGLRGPFALLEFPEQQDPDVVYIEHRRGDSIFRDEAVVTEVHKSIFRELERRASPPAALENHVNRALADLHID